MRKTHKNPRYYNESTHKKIPHRKVGGLIGGLFRLAGLGAQVVDRIVAANSGAPVGNIQPTPPAW